MEYNKEQQLNRLGDDLRKEYKDIIVDFILYDADARTLLVQKRLTTLSMFPGAWEFPGCHLEPHETLSACIKRLVYEEGQMYLQDVIDMVHCFTWDSNKDVVNLQFLVNATGTFKANKDKISEHRLITEEGLGLLRDAGESSPIYRGAFYAFEYIRMMADNKADMFKHILFFDRVITGFFTFLRCEYTPPRVVIGKENEKKFTLDKQKGILSVAPSFLRHYDQLGCASIILHLIFHNYQQNILSFDDVKSIRVVMGKNLMFYVDVVADVYTYLFFERFYGMNESQYRKLCHHLIAEYQADTVDGSKLTRLLGTFLTLDARSGQSFEVVLPVLGEDGNLHAMYFDKTLRYKQVRLGQTLQRKSVALATKSDVSIKEFNDTIERLISAVKAAK